MASNWIKDLNLNSYISLSTTPCQRHCSIASLQKEFQVWKAAVLPVSCFAKTHPADANTFHFTLAKATTIFLFIPFISFHIWQQKYQSDFQINQIKHSFRIAPLSYLLSLLPGGGLDCFDSLQTYAGILLFKWKKKICGYQSSWFSFSWMFLLHLSCLSQSSMLLEFSKHCCFLKANMDVVSCISGKAFLSRADYTLQSPL